MKLLPLDKLGAREQEADPGVVDFGVFFPWLAPADGNRVFVKIIHEKDQFLQDIPPMQFELAHDVDPDYGDYWSARVDIRFQPSPHPDSAWGSDGRYVYRYCVQNPNVPDPIDWVIDPYAREFGIGKLSAITLGYQRNEAYTWSDHETAWKTPAVDDLIIYELMITEFGGDIDRTIGLLDYLKDLGVNCIQLMPVSNVSNTVDWGYLPIGYFGVDERFGKRADMQRLIDAAHQRGLAVIVDSVYGHTSWNFPYRYLYDKLRYHENPFMGPFSQDLFGASTDFNRALTRDFFFSVNRHWLDTYHVDGFRYDCVPDFWDGPTGNGYAALVYETYRHVQSRNEETGHIQRFFGNGEIGLIQCAEQLEQPREVLQQSYSNLTWQNGTLDAADGTAHDGARLTDLGMRLALLGYPHEINANGDTLTKTALQYIENHDHARFLCSFRQIYPDPDRNPLFTEGDRGLWYKVQPYLIGLLTAKGVPLLWQGEEFGENYSLPDTGLGRTAMFRPVRWDYFYDDAGKKLTALVRKLVKVRQQQHFRRGDYYFYNDPARYQSNQVLLASRSDEERFSLIALNFSDQDQQIRFTFPIVGEYMEELDGNDPLHIASAGEEHVMTIPSNYGRIWTRAPAEP